MPDIDLARAYREQAPQVRRRLWRLGRRSDAEDLAQDTFVKAMAADAVAAESSAYLHTVAGNLVRDRWRRESRAATGLVRLQADASLSAPGAESLAVTAAQHAAVRAAVASLPREQQQVLRLRIVDGHSSAEVAALTGKAAATIRQVQHRALVTLRERLTASGWSPFEVAAMKQQEERP